MKKISYFLLAAIFLAGFSTCGQRGKPKEKEKVNVYQPESHAIDSTLPKTTVKFVELQHDFGQVPEGTKVVHVYELVNSGKKDLFLQSVRASCGCTTPKYDKKPIRPGKKGHIEVAFDSKGRSGKQRKSITVTANTEPANTVLFLTGEVIPAEKEETNNQ